MTQLFDRAVEAARNLPASVQDEIARLVLELAGDEQPAVQLADEEEESFAESLAQADRREFASDAEVRAIWAKYGL
ncbi:hypothetical protein [Mesorhizobium sp. IMUNJ 23232]|uniref:hypothetical protein n=1 Tax=Mesorhizobium sp. IMUNJ 23232 TaxID=3376064 RepID=UPI0037969491